MHVQRRDGLAQEFQRLTGVPVRWARAAGELISPTEGLEIVLRTATIRGEGQAMRIRKSGPSSMVTKLVKERQAEIEVRARSVRSDVDANEVYGVLEQRLDRGTGTPFFNGLDMAYIGLSPGIEVPNVAEYEGLAGAAVSECVGTLTLTLRDVDSEIDSFDSWIDTVDASGNPGGTVRIE